jgi:hypothetical protein
MDPDLYAEEAYKLGWFYNFAWLIIENNKDGAAVNRYLNNRYAMLFYRMILDEKTDEQTKEVGWKTDKVTRPILIADFAKVIRERAMVNPDKQSVQEYMDFVIKKTGKAEAKFGSHDDVCFADMLAFQAHQLMPFTDVMAGSYRWGKFGYRR